MTITFDPNGLAARARGTCDRTGSAFTVYQPRAPRLAVVILRGGDFLLRLVGFASLIVIAFMVMERFG